jgi:hypothetical protein
MVDLKPTGRLEQNYQPRSNVSRHCLDTVDEPVCCHFSQPLLIDRVTVVVHVDCQGTKILNKRRVKLSNRVYVGLTAG